MSIARTLGALALLGSVSCTLLGPGEAPQIARARVSEDFGSYHVQRVGVMPFEGSGLEPMEVPRGLELQQAFFAELSESTPWELVLLDQADLAEVTESEPHRRGTYRPRTIIETSRRYALDAIVFGTVMREQLFPPQELSVQLDLVAAETGLVIWSADVHVDATDPRVQKGLEVLYGGGMRGSEPWQLSLVSPSRFARYAASQVAELL